MQTKKTMEKVSKYFFFSKLLKASIIEIRYIHSLFPLGLGQLMNDRYENFRISENINSVRILQGHFFKFVNFTSGPMFFILVLKYSQRISI